MLIPQYSIRLMLAVLVAFAILSMVVAQAVRGASWAIAFTAGFVALIVLLMVNAVTFGGMWIASELSRRRAVVPVVSATAESPQAESVPRNLEAHHNLKSTGGSGNEAIPSTPPVEAFQVKNQI